MTNNEGNDMETKAEQLPDDDIRHLVLAGCHLKARTP